MAHQYFTEEHDLFRQSVKQFVQTEVRPNIDKWEAEQKIPREVFTKMASLEKRARRSREKKLAVSGVLGRQLMITPNSPSRASISAAVRNVASEAVLAK